MAAGGIYFMRTDSRAEAGKEFLKEKMNSFKESFSSGEPPTSADGKKDAGAIPRSMPADYALGVKLLKVAEENFQLKQYEKSRNDARIALQKFPFSDPHWHIASDIITRSSFAILYSSGDTAFEKKRIRIAKGDTLESLGLKYGVTPESILWGNPALKKIPGRKSPLPEGITLYIYCGKWSIKISNARKRLFVMDGDKLFAVYPVGIADGFAKAEVGSITLVTAKIVNPAWKIGKDLYPPGHPMNILGGFSMEFRDGKGVVPFRIHGTNREENVGRTIKGPGCISMKNANIKELFHLIPTGTRVEVIR